MVYPQRLLKPLRDFLDGMAGAPAETLVTVWNVEMTRTVDTIASR